MSTSSLSIKQCPITSVTVHSNAAVVQRLIPWTPTEAGEQTLCLRDICLACDSSSIRLTGTPECHIQEVTSETTKIKRSDIEPEKVTSTLAEAQRCIEDLKRLQAEKRKNAFTENLLEKKAELLRVHVEKQLSAVPQAGFQDTKGTNPEAVSQFLTFYSKTAEDIQKDIDCSAERQLEIEQNIALVSSRLRKLLNVANYISDDAARTPETWINAVRDFELMDVLIVTVNVLVTNVPREPQALTLSYHIRHNVQWRPAYDLRATMTSNVLELTYFARVSQSTGEDWTDVDLKLSTADVEESRRVPQLPRQVVRLKEAPQPPQPRAMLAYRSHLMATPATADVCLDDETSFVGSAPRMVNIEETGTGVTYRISKPWTIASDGAEHRVAIGTLKLPCEYIHVAVPSKSLSVFVMAQVENTSSFHLLRSHDVSVYMDGCYSGRTDLPEPVTPEKTFYVSLAMNPGISVVYIPEKRFSKETGILSVSKRRTYETSTYITFANDRDAAKTLVILACYPASSDAKITSKILEPVSLKELDEPTQSEELFKAIEASGTSRCRFLNKHNNHIMDVIPKIGDDKRIVSVLRYVVEWPKDEDIEVVSS